MQIVNKGSLNIVELLLWILIQKNAAKGKARIEFLRVARQLVTCLKTLTLGIYTDEVHRGQAGQSTDRAPLAPTEFRCTRGGMGSLFPFEDRLLLGGIDFEGLVQALDWNREETVTFVESRLRSVSLVPTLVVAHETQGIFFASQHYCDDANLKREIELWFLRSTLRYTLPHGTWYAPWVVSYRCDREDDVSDFVRSQGEDLSDFLRRQREERQNRWHCNTLVDRFLAVGWSIGQIRDEFLAVIEEESNRGLRRRIPPILDAIGRSKCFDSDEDKRLVRRHLDDFWRTFNAHRG